MTASAAKLRSVIDPPTRMVCFEPSGDDHEIAIMGVIEVGQIGACAVGGLWYWRLWLPGCAKFGRASSRKEAANHLTVRVEQWVEAAGLQWGKS